MITHNLEETKALAVEFAKQARPNVYFLLSGDLGTGKTTFTKALIKELGVDEVVSSPTFVIMNQYESETGLKINHVDAYRLNNDSEIEMYTDEFDNAFNIIEWYENMNLDLSKINWVKIDIVRIDDTTREFKVEASN